MDWASYDVHVVCLCGQEEECSLVILTGQTYDMEDEVYVERRVVVQGSPATMPMLDAGEGIRSFRVKVSTEGQGGERGSGGRACDSQ